LAYAIKRLEFRPDHPPITPISSDDWRISARWRLGDVKLPGNKSPFPSDPKEHEIVSRLWGGHRLFATPSLPPKGPDAALTVSKHHIPAKI
jgi:hypothetical protein